MNWTIYFLKGIAILLLLSVFILVCKKIGKKIFRKQLAKIFINRIKVKPHVVELHSISGDYYITSRKTRIKKAELPQTTIFGEAIELIILINGVESIPFMVKTELAEQINYGGIFI